jgi:hypothetical protein
VITVRGSGETLQETTSAARQGKIIPVGKEKIVINDRCEGLYPHPALFKTAKDVPPAKLPAIRRRQG